MGRTVIFIGVLFVFFSGLSALLAVREESILLDQATRMEGARLLSFFSLNIMDKTTENERAAFSKGLIDSFTLKGLVYLTLHASDKAVLYQLMPPSKGFKVPETVISHSLSAVIPTVQRYTIQTIRSDFYEFSKPAIKDNKTVTLRMGMRIPTPQLFSKRNRQSMAMMALSILALSGLYILHIKTLLKPLFTFASQLSPQKEADHELIQPNHWTTYIDAAAGKKNIQQITKRMSQKINHIKEEKTRLSSEIGLLSFEKKQVTDILNLLNTGVVVTNVQDAIIFVNDTIVNLIKKDREQILDRRFDGIFENKELLSYFHHMGSFEKEAAQSAIEAALKEFSNSDIFRIFLKTLFDATQTPIAKLILIQNITRETASEKANIEFTAHLTHELMTPLTSIKSYSEMLMDGDIEDLETQKEFYNTINQETDRLSGLIKDLLNLSKIEMGSLELNKSLVRSDWLFEDCLKTIEGTAQKKQITLEREAPDNFPILIGDKELLKTAMINILGNAVKYTPKEGSVRFSLKETEEMVLFEVRDTGYGIPEKDIEKIFDKFFRSENPKTEDIQGTGLGLAITNEIIRLHDGEIKVKSIVGKGTAFLIKIPKEEYYLAA